MEKHKFKWSSVLETICERQRKNLIEAQNSAQGIKFISKEGNTVLQLYLLYSFQVDFDVVKQLIDQCGAMAKHRNKHQYSALMIASENYSTTFKTFKLLIDIGMDVNAKNAQHKNVFQTYISWRVWDETLDPLIVQLMIKAQGLELEDFAKSISYYFKVGVDINIQDKEGNNILHLITASNSEQKSIQIYKDRVEKIIQAGIYLYSLNNKQQNVIHTFLILHQKQSSDKLNEILRFFIDKKVKVDGQDYEGKNVLHRYLECDQANQDGVELLIHQGIKVNNKCNLENYPLQQYLKNSKNLPEFGIIQSLIESGAKVNQHDRKGNNELQIITMRYDWSDCIQDYINLTNLLIKAGVNINNSNILGINVLHVFLAKNSEYTNEKLLEIFSYFITKGLDLNCSNQNGKNILHRYLDCSYKNEEGVKLLIQAGINLNQRCIDGNTPLQHYLKQKESYDHNIVKIFCETAGVNLNNKNKAGKTALKQLMERIVAGQIEFTASFILVEAGADLNFVFQSTHILSGMLKNTNQVLEAKPFFLAGLNPKKLSKQEYKLVQTNNFLKNCFLEKEMLLIKLLKNRKQINRTLAKIPIGVFREITRYV